MQTDDFFRALLDQMIDLRHPLAVLANWMPWAQIESTLGPAFERQNRSGQAVEGSDLFGPTLAMAGGGISAAGRPRLPIRLMGLKMKFAAATKYSRSTCLMASY